MKSKHEIPNKHDFMKAHSFNFIENEKADSGLMHEKNAGKPAEFYKYGEASTEKPSISSTHCDLTQKNRTEDEDASRTYEGIQKTETSIITDWKTDFSGRAPKRYTTRCYIKPVTRPIWYTESLYLNIGSTKRKYEEKIYFKNKLAPYKWTETMYTEIKTVPKRVVSDIHIPVQESDIHYISLEPQQVAAGTK